MALASGSRLGPYEIVAPLGAGGMGEVYRARDTRLGREVAVKVLPAGAADDPERLRRFEQEARAVSALNHPNIVTLFEVGESEHGPYLVLERIEGRSLRELLRDQREGALPVKRVLALGAQIADGLAKAHSAGIVHRDLKPENVMVTEDGFAKILDFGLAKLVYPELASAGDVAQMTTLVEKSASGMIVGTLGYLSPEQAAGRPVDFRADQFALGALLYELATGERPFRRETTPETLTAILREEPEPLRTKNAALPAPLGWIVERCLAKDPNDRYASTKDLARDLTDLRDRRLEVSSTDFVATESDPKRTRRARLLPWSIALVSLLAAIFVLLTHSAHEAPSLPIYRPLTFQKGVVTGARFSPDGQSVYYSASFGAQPPQVFMTRLDGTRAVPLDLPPASLLSVSPKGELALLLGDERNPHHSVGTLARASALGGTPRPLRDGVIDADWAPDGEQLVIQRAVDGAIEFPASHVLVPAGRFPRLSPDGRLLASRNDASIAIVDLQGRHVADHDFFHVFGLSWRPDGRELWFTGSRTGDADRMLYALALDGKLRELASAPVTMTIEDIARDGRLALVTTGAGWYSIRTGERGLPNETRLDLFGRTELVDLSDDGRWILLDEGRASGAGTYLSATDGSRTVLLFSNREPLGLSPDGAWVLTSKESSRSPELVLIPTGAGTQRTVALDASLHADDRYTFGGAAHWSRDGKRLFVRLRSGDNSGIYFHDEAGRWHPIAGQVDEIDRFAVSPDGSSVAANQGGSLKLFTVDGGAVRELPVERARPIRFSLDGRWLYFERLGPLRVEVGRFDLANGRIEPWMELTFPDPVGVVRSGGVLLSGDGARYANRFVTSLNTLYLVEGLK